MPILIELSLLQLSLTVKPNMLTKASSMYDQQAFKGEATGVGRINWSQKESHSICDKNPATLRCQFFSHLTIMVTVRCKVCNKYISKSNISTHKKSAAHKKNEAGIIPALRPLQCPTCSVTFSRSSNLQRHISSKHSNIQKDVKYNYYCTICDIPIRDSTHKKKHWISSTHCNNIREKRPDLTYYEKVGNIPVGDRKIKNGAWKDFVVTQESRLKSKAKTEQKEKKEKKEKKEMDIVDSNTDAKPFLVKILNPVNHYDFIDNPIILRKHLATLMSLGSQNGFRFSDNDIDLSKSKDMGAESMITLMSRMASQLFLHMYKGSEKELMKIKDEIDSEDSS